MDIIELIKTTSTNHHNLMNQLATYVENLLNENAELKEKIKLLEEKNETSN